MNITINTQQKTIKVNESVNLKELFQFLTDSVNGWEEYKLEYGIEQVIIDLTPKQPYPFYPFDPFNPIYVTC